MRKELTNTVLHDSNIKYIFTDYFDTIVHRKVHPNYTLRLWAKHMIQQLALPMTIDTLYFTRNEATGYITSKTKLNASEVPYKQLLGEIYRRLKNNNLQGSSKGLEYFVNISEAAEYKAEVSVQFLNTETVEALKHLKSKGCKIYCVSDFYTSESLIKQLICAHGLRNLFEDVFVSSERGCSKHVGGMYDYLITYLNIEPNQILMIGDNYRSDITNAQKAGIKGIYIPNKHQKRIQKKLLFGNDYSDYNKIINQIYKKCNHRKAPPYSDYIIFFAFFTEKLYAICIKKDIKDLFFLAREGLFLKRLFDHYQDVNGLKNNHHINTHYLKMSRQAALQIDLKQLEEENFNYFREYHKNLSVEGFLNNFCFSDYDCKNLINSLGLNESGKKLIKNFFDSNTYKHLVSNPDFKAIYEANRIAQKKAFNSYIKSFNVPFENQGINLIDIGWNGTMQDKLFEYFENKVPVYGYYLGLKDLRPSIEFTDLKTGRWGLNFETNPYTGYSDHLMMANTELYEQLAQAPHGSTLGYQNNPNQYAVEYHESHEKQVYEDYIKDTQDFMFNMFKEYCESTNTICYDPYMAKNVTAHYALKIGTIIPKRKLNRVIDLSKGFFSNVGNNEVGEDCYKMSVREGLKHQIPILKNYLTSPEKMVKYIMRSKLRLYKKNKLFYMPTLPVYYYICLVRYAKKLIRKKLYLKYAHFK
ncbi:hypothetical protein GCM10023311_25830 [Flaviramulus aquimarinus]|uniref:HAD family hydrolase n=1 Tax=Flaviramulus aquimarinus TaxID=1170456 RepID=A0ABP9FDW2_9FLAO